MAMSEADLTDRRLANQQRASAKQAQREERRTRHQRLIRAAAFARARGDLLGAQRVEERAAKVLADLQLVG